MQCKAIKQSALNSSFQSTIIYSNWTTIWNVTSICLVQHSSSFHVTVKFPHPVIYEPDVHVMLANMSAQAGEIKQERTHWPLSSQLPNVSVTSIYCSLRLHIIPSTWDQIWLRNSLKYLRGQPVCCEMKGDNEMETWMRHHPHILNNSGNVIFAKPYMMYSSSSQAHLLLTGILYMYVAQATIHMGLCLKTHFFLM